MRRLLAVLVLAGASVQAEITYYFGGTLSESIGGFDAGTNFSGSFSYSRPIVQLINAAAQYDLQVNIGGTSLYFPPLTVLIGGVTGLNVRDGELFFERKPLNSDHLGGGNYPQNNGRFLGFGLKLIDTSQQNLSSWLPDENIRLPMLSSAYIWLSEYSQEIFGGNPPDPGYVPTPISYSYTKTQESQSSLTSLVPEPSSLSLLLAGGAVFAAARRRKVD